MKVLHLNTHAEGGSYVYASVLSRALEECGVESRVVTRNLDQRRFADKLLRRATLAFAKGAWHGTRRTGFPPDPKLLEGVDVVHLHTVADWFDVTHWLESLPARVKVVVSLHDLWHVSGGCFLYGSCEQFKTGCGNCPLLRFPANRILAAAEVRRKAKAYRDRDARFVANSQWLRGIVRESRILNGAEVAVIPPPVDTSVFRPLDRVECRREFGLQPEDRVVATGCASLTDANKDTLGLLNILAGIGEPRLRVLVFGNGSIPAPPGLEVQWLGPMKSKESLARIYNAADVFASASRMETYGLTLAEAQACRTPVVAYRVGGIPEAVRLSEENVLCSLADRESLGIAIIRILETNRAVTDLEVDQKALHQQGYLESAARDLLEVYAS